MVRNLTYSARLASMLLLLVWVGPVTFVQTDSWQLLRSVGAPALASADARVISAGSALSLEPGMSLKAHLRGGSVLQRRFLGRTLLDSAVYAPRFEKHARTSAYVPFAMGETLHVSLRDGRQWTAPFAGYAELTLLLRSSEGPPYLRVPFEFASEIRRANGDRVEPRDLARAFHRHSLPSAEALAIEDRGAIGSEAERWASALRVAAEDIESVEAGIRPGTSVAGIVLLSVVLTVVLVFVLLAAAFNSGSKGCSPQPVTLPPLLGEHLTRRPFDRYRGCYVGEPLAAADPWPGSTQGGPATALATPATSRVTVR